MRKFFLGTLMILLSIFGKAQDKKWNIETYVGPSKTFNIQTNEGTWMNLDVSPDGQEIVFDLLGDIYTIPMSGGTARLLSGGTAWEEPVAQK